MAVGSTKALGSYVIHVGLQDVGVSQSLSTIKNAVRASSSEMKAQMSIFNSLGDDLNKAKSQYEGLTKTIEAQQKVIEKQRSQFQSMGKRTSENAAQYDKLATQINNNVKQMATLTAQQEKAKQAYEYEKSGIRGNKEELSLLNREMTSSIKLLMAEGKEQEANKVKAEGLQSQIHKLTDVREKERSILEKIKSESGDTSSAYREQALRINELSTKIAEARNQYGRMGDAAESDVRKMDRLKSAASRTHDVFKGSFFGSLAGNVVSNALMSISSGFHSVISAGTEENKTLEKVQLTWTNFTHSAKQGEAFTKIIEEMHEKSHYSLESISTLNKMMFALTKNKKDMEELSDSIQHVGRAAGLNDSQIDAIGKKLAQVGVNGKISFSDVSKMTKQLPGFSSAMAQSMGIPMSKLVAMGKAGKLTGKDFQDIIKAMGRANEGSFKNYEHTTAGFSAAMHDTWDKLSAHLMKPIFNSHKSGLADLTKMVQSKDIQKGAEAIGQGLSSIMSAASKQLNSFAKYAQSHKTQLKAGLNEIKGSLTNVWNFAKPILSFLTTHPKILAGVATGFLGIAAALKVTTTAMAIAKIGVNGLKMALISSGIGIAVAAIGIAAVELITHWKQVKAFFGGLGSWFKGIWHGITSGISSFVSGVSKKWNGFANGTKDKFNDARKSAVSATNSMVNQVANKHSWLNQHTNGAASDMFKGLKKTFKNGYNTMHDYTNTWSDVIHGRWSKVGGDIGQTAKDAMKTAKSAFHTGYGVLNDLTGGWLGKTVGWFEDLPGRIAKGVKKGWKTIEQAFIDLGNGMIRGIGKGVNGVIGGIDWILDKVKAPEIKPWKVPQFANGGLASGLSVVGEKGKHELIKHDDGTMELSPNKATLYNFKKPVQILGGDKTEQLMKMLPKFGIGTWLGSAVDFVKGGFNAISSSADNFWNAITHPAQLLNTAIDKFTDLSGLNGTIADMAKGTVTYAAKESLNWIKKIFDSESADPTGTGVKRWTTDVHKTLSMLDLSQSLTAKVLKQISTESGGNAKALGGDDGLNDGRAMGLMQVKPGTFSAYHLSGHNDIWNGFDNMLAGLNYAKHRYGSGLSYLGHGHGYANGGLVTQHQIAELAEGNKAEMVVPLTNTTRSIQLLSQATDYLATKLGIKQQSNDSSQAVSNTISMPINITINGNTDQNTAKQLAQMVAKQLNNTLKAQGLKLV